MTKEQPFGPSDEALGAATGHAPAPPKSGIPRVLWLHTQPEHYHNCMLDDLQRGDGYRVQGMDNAHSEQFQYIAAFAIGGPNWYQNNRPSAVPSVILRARPGREDRVPGFCENYHQDWRQDLLGLGFSAAIVSGYAVRTFRQFLVECRRRGIPVAMWSDSNIRSDRGHGIKNRLKRCLKRGYLRRLTRQVDYLMTANRRGQAYWRYYGGPDACRKIVISPCYADYRRIDAAKNRPREAVLQPFGLSPQDRYAFSSARLVPAKGLDLMIRAFRQGGYEQRGWKYLIAGVGSEETALKKLAGPSLGRSIHLLGFQQPEQNLALMAHADIMVLPSRFEPHGIVVGEALAAGTPVLLSDIVGAAAGLVHHGVCGLLFRNNSLEDLAAKLRILDDPPALKRLRAAARPAFEAWYRKTSPILVVPRVVRAMLARGRA